MSNNILKKYTSYQDTISWTVESFLLQIPNGKYTDIHVYSSISKQLIGTTSIAEVLANNWTRTVKRGNLIGEPIIVANFNKV